MNLKSPMFSTFNEYLENFKSYNFWSEMEVDMDAVDMRKPGRRSWPWSSCEMIRV